MLGKTPWGFHFKIAVDRHSLDEVAWTPNIGASVVETQSQGQNSQQVARILTAQIVHELKTLPRGAVSAETVLLTETAYKLSTALEDVLGAIAKAKKVPA
jgi:hypothetical protein